MKLHPTIGAAVTAHAAAVLLASFTAACVGPEPPPTEKGGGGDQGSTTQSGSAPSSSSGSSAQTCDPDTTTCNATIASGAVPLCGHYLAAGVLGKGGYAYPYADTGGSTACMHASALCLAGVTAPFTATTDPTTTWGAGMSIALDQAVSSNGNAPPMETYAVPGNGVAYALTNVPTQGIRLVIDDSGTQYCAQLRIPTGTALWSQFNTKCWDGTGTTLTHAPATASTLNVQVVAAGATSQSYNFCLTAIAFSE
jgi:hypothetical protein